MENNIKYLSDITYLSELTPLLSCESKKGGLILPHRFVSLLVKQSEPKRNSGGSLNAN